MARRLVSADDYRSAFKAKKNSTLAVRMEQAGAITKSADGGIDIIVSTDAVDRSKDVVHQDGWKLGNFLKNPVVLFAHNSWDLPVGKAPQMVVEAGAGGSRLVAKGVEFVPRDVDLFAGTVGDMVKGGWLNAASVGFQPIKYAFAEDRGTWAMDFLEQELLEFSIVPVPANPEALVGAKAAGIDLAPLVDWASKLLDSKPKLEQRASLEELYKLARPLVVRGGRGAARAKDSEEGDDASPNEDTTQACDCPDGTLVKCSHCDGYMRCAAHAPDQDGDGDGDGDGDDSKSLRTELALTKAALADALKRIDALERKAAPAAAPIDIAAATAAEVKRQISALMGRVD